ncbi:hypothetical protein [Sorangium cellulosum]|nr:hypothetical protein [Sorangium cellulosum]
MQHRMCPNIERELRLACHPTPAPGGMNAAKRSLALRGSTGWSTEAFDG